MSSSSSFQYAFVPVQSFVMGAMIALTDVLLKPGLRNGLESFLLYFAQSFILYFIYQAQSGGALCPEPAKAKNDKDRDWSKIFLKTASATALLFITDLMLRPEHVTNLWIQFLKFIIQGALVWHMFNRDWGIGSA